MTKSGTGSTPLATATAVALSLGSPAMAEDRPSVAPKAMQAVAPALADYTDKVLFGDVWERAELSPRDRSMVTLSVLISTGKAAQLGGHLGRGLNNGVTPAQVAGMVTHLAFYSGWPNAVSALNVIEPVFVERKIDRAQLDQARFATGYPSATHPLSVAPEAETLAPKFAELTSQIIFTDLWQRSDLSPRDRSLVTIVAMAANGDTEQLPAYIARAQATGWNSQQIGEIFTHLAFYAGWPKASAAIAILAKMPASTSVQGDARLVVVPSGVNAVSAPSSNFTGEVTVSSSFSGSGLSRLRGASVHFEKGARTHWHAHPLGQLLMITAGQGWVQVENETPVKVKAGDVIWTAPGVKHWHGASATSEMTHVALSETAKGQEVTWLGPVVNEDTDRK